MLTTHCAERLIRMQKTSIQHNVDEVKYELNIVSERLYAHATLGINYTAYDVRRKQDSINVNTDKCDIMTLPAATEHDAPPFRFARVLRIWHANVSHPTLAPDPIRLNLLFVRWFEPLAPPSTSWDPTELDQVAFVPGHHPDAFSFLDPAQILRAAHLIPSFADGRTGELLGPSIFQTTGGDYKAFYVGQ